MNNLSNNDTPFSYTLKPLYAAINNGLTRISVDSNSTQGINDSNYATLSADGRYIAFSSNASNLVSGDTNSQIDIFLRDTQTSTTQRLSTASDGSQAVAASSNAAISSDGQFVVFQSAAGNLVSNDTNNLSDIFLKSINSGTTQRISTSTTLVQSNGDSTNPAISSDGHYVAFASNATNLVSGDTNNQIDIFLKNTQTGAIQRVSTDNNGVESNNISSSPSVSADGRYVAFLSAASNLVANDTNGMVDLFIKDTQTGAIQRVSTDSSGNQSNNHTTSGMISADGQHIVFSSTASNLVANDTNNQSDIFLKNTQTGAIQRVSTDSANAQGNGSSDYPAAVSSDGHYVTFSSTSSNLVANDNNNQADIFVKDTWTHAIQRVSVSSTGTESNNASLISAISGTGEYIAFSSAATNLVSNDTNSKVDVFRAQNLLFNSTPVITINNAQITEGDSGTKNLDFTINLTSPALSTITLDYATGSGNATAGVDYTATHGTVTFNTNDTSKTISVPIIGDTNIESDETFSFTLSNLSGTATFSGGNPTLAATGTILNDDGVVTLPTISITSPSITEGNSSTKNLDFTVTLSSAATTPVTLNYATQDGTATLANNDYTSTTGSLSFAVGDLSKTISVPIVGDTTVESNETFNMVLSSLTGSAAFSGGGNTLAGTGTITNDDVASTTTVSIANVQTTEGNSGTKNLTFTVSLNAAATAPISLNYATQDGTATIANNDYTNTLGSLSFAVGDSSKTISVPIIGDTTVESDETFQVILSNLTGTNVNFSNNNTTLSATGTIQNDDSTGTIVSITNPQVTEGNSGTTNLTFTVSLNAAATAPISLNYATQDGTATIANNDYTNTLGSLSFAVGDSSKTISVPIIGDTTVESDETFQVILSNLTGTNVNFSNSNTTLSATGTILNDDGNTNNALIFLDNNKSINILDNAKVFGASGGTESVKIYDSANAIIDQNIERVELYGNLSQYGFQVQGNQVYVYNSNSAKIATVSVQGDADGTTFLFADGKASLLITGLNQATLGGQNISSVTPTILTTAALGANFSTAEKSSVGAISTTSTNNLSFLTSGSTLTAIDAAKIFGSLGSETLKIIGAPNLLSDQNMERLEFDGPLASYGFTISGNIASIYQLDGAQNLASIVVKLAVQDDADGTLLVFSDGATSLKLTGLSHATLGGTAFTNASPLIVTNSGTLGGNFDPNTTSSVGNSTQTVNITGANSTPFNASLSHTTFNFTSGNYIYNIDHFNVGDKLAFPAGTALSISNENAGDGIVDVNGTTSTGQWINIHLTGIYPSQDASILGVTSFNTVFGAGSLA